MVAIEASKPERRARRRRRSSTARAYRIRCPGSIAVSLCYVAASRFDGMLSTRNCRSVDAAAAQLIVREAGGAARASATASSADAPLDLDARYDIAAARTAADLATLREAQRGGAA